MPAFVVLRHEIGAKLPRTARDPNSKPVHFDWMFQSGETLHTWSTPPITRFDQPIEIDAYRLKDHRLAYLEIEGDIGRNRGTVTRLIKGSYVPSEESSLELFVATITWSDSKDQTQQRQLSLHRTCRGDDGFWRLRLGE